MATKPLPLIDQQRCDGCGRCVAICPTGALAVVAGKAVLHYPDHCIYCTACEEACPTNAIALPFVIILKTQEKEN